MLALDVVVVLGSNVIIQIEPVLPKVEPLMR